MPIPSAQVRVQGLNIGATTDDQGRFVLNNVPAGTVTIVAQRLGYVMGQSQVTVTSGGAATVSFQLTRAPLALDQVVTIGYGTADRRNLTSAVEQVNGDELATRPVPNLTQGLAGRAAQRQHPANGRKADPVARDQHSRHDIDRNRRQCAGAGRRRRGRSRVDQPQRRRVDHGPEGRVIGRRLRCARRVRRVAHHHETARRRISSGSTTARPTAPSSRRRFRTS